MKHHTARILLCVMTYALPTYTMKEKSSTLRDFVDAYKALRKKRVAPTTPSSESASAAAPEIPDNPAFPYVLEKKIDDISVTYPSVACTSYDDGKKMALWPEDHTGYSGEPLIQLYDINKKTLETVPCSLPKIAAIQDVAVSPLQNYIVASYVESWDAQEGTIIVYSVPAGGTFTLEGKCDAPFAPVACDEKTVAGVSAGVRGAANKVALWDIGTQKKTTSFDSDSMDPCEITFVPEHSIIGASVFSHLLTRMPIRIWDTKSGKVIIKQNGFINTFPLAFNRDATLFGISGCGDKGDPAVKIKVFDLRNPTIPISTRKIHTHDQAIMNFYFHHDNTSYFYSTGDQLAWAPIEETAPAQSAYIHNISYFGLNADDSQIVVAAPTKKCAAALQIWKQRASKTAPAGMCITS